MIKWIGTICNVLGSFLIANRFFLIGYALFIIGCFAWFIVARRQRDNAMLTMNFVFLCANVNGIVNAIL